MKRMHVHVGVDDLPNAIGFYSALFATQPAVVKPDYAKWMLDDPRVNFAISTRGKQPGLDHLGIQVESQDELQEVYARLRQAGGNIIEQGQTSCAMRSRKSPGSKIRPASHGKLSSLPARARTTATLDFVFTVCDNAAGETCPVWPGQPMTAHWGVPDPAEAKGSPAEIALAFKDAYRMLHQRIGVFTALPIRSLDQLSLQQRLKEIGRMDGATAKAKEPT